MKAIVMAGGEGTRLRPVTAGKPKPMAELFGRPVLEHTVELLKRNGITEICFTLRYLPGVIAEWFGDGAAFGVRIETRTEREPLGTAGGVRACLDFIGDEDVLVISGDAVCDFDLKECIAFHRERNAEATLVLYEHPRPLEYGLVVTDESGRIRRFIEKPSWDMVVTDAVNTGIYVLSPQAVRDIPEGQCDFGRELFPKMLNEGRRLYGICAGGYWCDIGSPEAYRECCMDILTGKTRILGKTPERRPGVFSESALSAGVKYAPPVWIGKNCILEKGARIGPDTVLGDGSAVGAGASIEGSVVNGASIGANVAVSGAIIGRGSVIGRDCRIEKDAILGDGVKVGDGALIAHGVRLWPDTEIAAGVRVSEDITEEGGRERLVFGEGASISGKYPHELSSEMAIELGGAAAVFGRVGVAYSGGDAARVLAYAFSCGVCGAGADAVETDAAFPSEAAFAFQLYALSAGVFIRQDGTSVKMTFFGKNGRLLDGAGQRKLESAAARGRGSPKAGSLTRTEGITQAYIAEAVRQTGGIASDFEVCVSGRGAENRALREALSAAGCRVSPREKLRRPCFDICDGGFSVMATDEESQGVSIERMQVITALCAMKNGAGVISAEHDAPAALETVAETCGGRVLRVLKDGETAEKLYAEQRFMRDGIFSACSVAAYMAKSGVTLSELNEKVPGFVIAQKSVATPQGAARAMRELSASYAEFSDELIALSADTELGRVHVAPCQNGKALFIKTEGGTEELAEELCAEFEKRISDGGK